MNVQLLDEEVNVHTPSHCIDGPDLTASPRPLALRRIIKVTAHSIKETSPSLLVHQASLTPESSGGPKSDRYVVNFSCFPLRLAWVQVTECV
jgi:hypothetical protein